MPQLEHIIALLNKEEIRHLKIFLKRTNSNNDRKDITLFDYIRKAGEHYDDTAIMEQLYGSKGKNTLYRLRNRLLDDIGKSLLLQYYNSSDSNLVLHYLAISRHFRERSQFRPATYFLGKAEKKAKQMSSLEFLDIIYSDFIRISQESLSIDPEVYIKKRNALSRELELLRNIDDALAVLTYRIKRSQNFSRVEDDVVPMLQSMIDDLSLDEDLLTNPTLRFRVYHALSRILLQQLNYPALEAYLLDTWEAFSREELFNRNNHDTKLQMLTFLVNALFKNGKYESSLVYVQTLLESMREYDRLLYYKYLYYYYNAMVNNYTVLDQEEAIRILNRAIRNPTINKVQPQSRLIFYLNLALLHFARQELRQASRSIVTLKLDESFPQLDQAFQLKIHIVELIVRYELEDHDFIDYNASRLRKTFDSTLKDPAYSRQKKVIILLEKMVRSTNLRERPIQNDMRLLTEGLPDHESRDSDILSYNEWLRPKMEMGS